MQRKRHLRKVAIVVVWTILVGASVMVALGALLGTAYRLGYRLGDREGEARARRRMALDALSGRVTWKFERTGRVIHAASPGGADYFGRCMDFAPFDDSYDWTRSDGVDMAYDEERVVSRAYKAWSLSERIYNKRAR